MVLLELRFAHLPVAHADAGLRDQFLDHRRPRPDRVDAVVHEVHLAAARQFQLDRGPDQLRIEGATTVWIGQPILGRRLDHRHVAQAQQRHVQRARNRRGAHAEHDPRFLSCFSRSLCLTPKRCSSSTITRPRSRN